MKKQIFLIFILFLIAENASAQNCISDNFPLKIGNSFTFSSTYIYQLGPNYSYSKSYYRTTITKDTVMNGHKYYFLTKYRSFSNKWWRLDSASGRLFIYGASYQCTPNLNEKLTDSLCSLVGNTFKGCDDISDYSCTEDGFFTFLTQSVQAKRFFTTYGFGSSSTGIYWKVDSKFGLETYYVIQSGSTGATAKTGDTLRGAIIDGILYGDTSTTTTSVSLLNSSVPEAYNLLQNYPNPFNPSTRINYKLRNSNYVTLKVFDLLGKEVATLVNEKQNAGSYAVDFNSSEFNLTSGIYFYTLNAGEFKETRKMVLVK